MAWKPVTILCLVPAFCFGCTASSGDSRNNENGNQSRVRTFVTILPQADFVRRIGKDKVAVDVLVGPGQSHHTYEPTARQMTLLSQSQIYFSIGVPCEFSLLPKIADANHKMLIVDTSEGVKFRADASCGEHDHDHDAHDPHIWLDPRLVIIQARHIRDGLKQIDPQNSQFFEQNCAEFERQLQDLNNQLTGQFVPYKGREILVFHPAYGYFTDAYGIRQLAVEQDGKEPAVKYLASLIDKAKSAQINTVFVQPQFPSASADTIASAIHGKTVPLDPMTNDYLLDMREIARRIIASFAGQNEPVQSAAAINP